MNSGKTAAQRILETREDGNQKKLGDLPDFRDLADGGVLWKASLEILRDARVLLHYLEKNALQDIRGKKVLELGSGSGHLAVSLAGLGAHVTCTERSEMGALDLLQKRVKHANSNTYDNSLWGSCRAMELEWGEHGVANSPLSKEGNKADYDVIIMSELVYEEESHELLVETLQKLCSPHTVIYSIFCDRPFSFMFFVKLHDAGGFDVQQIADGDLDLLGMEPDAKVCMHRITVKSN